MFRKKINVPIFTSTVYVGVTDSFEEFFKKYNIECDSVNYDAITLSFADRGLYYVVFKDIAPDTIAHEVVHLKNYIFAHKGQQLDLHNDEVEAYFTGYLFRVINDAINRQ